MTRRWMWAALGVVLLVACASQAQAYTKVVQVRFRYADATVSGGIADKDSTTLHGNVQTLDSTLAIDIRSARVPANGSTNQAIAYARLNLVCTGVTSTDSAFVVVEGSPDGQNFQSNATFVGHAMPSGGGTSNVISVPLTFDYDNLAGGTPMFHPYVRFVLRPDGNTAAILVVTKAYFSFSADEKE